MAATVVKLAEQLLAADVDTRVQTAEALGQMGEKAQDAGLAYVGSETGCSSSGTLVHLGTNGATLWQTTLPKPVSQSYAGMAADAQYVYLRTTCANGQVMVVAKSDGSFVKTIGDGAPAAYNRFRSVIVDHGQQTLFPTTSNEELIYPVSGAASWRYMMPLTRGESGGARGENFVHSPLAPPLSPLNFVQAVTSMRSADPVLGNPAAATTFHNRQALHSPTGEFCDSSSDAQVPSPSEERQKGSGFSDQQRHQSIPRTCSRRLPSSVISRQVACTPNRARTSQQRPRASHRPCSSRETCSWRRGIFCHSTSGRR